MGVSGAVRPPVRREDEEHHEGHPAELPLALTEDMREDCCGGDRFARRPSASRTRLTDAQTSGAESMSVPSRSKRNAENPVTEANVCGL